MAEDHLDVYGNRSVLHSGSSATPFVEGRQSEAASTRYAEITQAFEDGFYDAAMGEIPAVLEKNELSAAQQELIKSLVNGLTSEVGRALVGLSCLQLAIKSVAPSQSVRLHKGGNRSRGFSWQEGISMRTLDRNFNTPFLRQSALLNLNRDGIMMTRSLAENYPYSRLYKAELRGPIAQWVDIVKSLEDESLPPYPALCYLLSLLLNRSNAFSVAVENLMAAVGSLNVPSFEAVAESLKAFFTTTTYSARAFEVVIHAFVQALCELELVDGTLVPLSQMRSANKKHGNVGDIEIMHDDLIVVSWDAKYGKPYLRDELEELNDKLYSHPSVEIAGFITNCAIDRTSDILGRVIEISDIHECEILLLSFDEWIEQHTDGLGGPGLSELANRWLIAVVESFGQKRPRLAPIDEPCDDWISDLAKVIGALSAPDGRR